jgi:non-heme chloroperoxidase
MKADLKLEQRPAGAPIPVATHEIRGGGGVRLHTREWGRSDQPALLLIHGWSQSDLCWTKQLSGELARDFRIVTFDLRGHGLSERPAAPDAYTDPQLWAEDVAAVIEGTGLQRPVLVAWSYGGYVVTDYLRVFGDGAIAAINLVGASVVLRPPGFDHHGPGILENVGDACAPDLATNIAAMRRFLDACTRQPLDEDESLMALSWNMVVPPAVRGALLAREIDGSDALARMSVPVLVTHGKEDEIVLPSMARHSLEVCASATASWYDGVGHMPFWEAPERFDRELREFADQALGNPNSGLTRSSRKRGPGKGPLSLRMRCRG